jgi:hypothetical protein
VDVELKYIPSHHHTLQKIERKKERKKEKEKHQQGSGEEKRCSKYTIRMPDWSSKSHDRRRIWEI